MKPWALILLCLPLFAEAQDSCRLRFRRECRELGTRPILANYADQTVLFNPAVLTGELQATDAAWLMARQHPTNVADAIRPAFEELRLAAIALVEADGRALGDTAFAHLADIRLEMENRARCTRPDRTPLVAGFDAGRMIVTICPMMTHLRAASLLSILAHELGHALDGCGIAKGETPRQLADLQTRVYGPDCGRADADDEVFADGAGGLLLRQALASRPTLSQVAPFATASVQRFREYMNYRMVGCSEPVIYPGVELILAQAQGPLACDARDLPVVP